MSERWCAVLAAMTNPELRAVLAEAMAAPPATAARRERAITRLVDLGLVARGDGDELTFRVDTVQAMLADSAVARPTDVERFFTPEGRIARYPKRERERIELLTAVADRVLAPDEVLGERELNGRLGGLTDDIAALRRALVDHEVLERTRSGSAYARLVSG